MLKLKREQFLPAITTTYNSDWRAKIKEADRLGLKEVAVFPTCLNRFKREEFFGLIKQSSIERIPFAHMRTDMTYEEIDWLIKEYGTKVFNIHPREEHPHLFDYSRYKGIVYLENIYRSLEESELQQWSGICLDFSHFENYRLTNFSEFQKLEALLKKYPIGCNHISAVAAEKHIDNKGQSVYADHHFAKLSEFDYLENYPLSYFSQFIAMELENSLAEQLEARDYILKFKNAD